MREDGERSQGEHRAATMRLGAGARPAGGRRPVGVAVVIAVSLAACFWGAGEAASGPAGASVQGAHASAQGAVASAADPRTAIECETQQAFRRIGPRDYVLEPRVRCLALDASRSPAPTHDPGTAKAGSPTDEEGIDAARKADRPERKQFARTPDAASPARDRAAEGARVIASELRVRWTADRSRLENVQGLRSERAMRERIVRR